MGVNSKLLTVNTLYMHIGTAAPGPITKEVVYEAAMNLNFEASASH